MNEFTYPRHAEQRGMPARRSTRWIGCCPSRRAGIGTFLAKGVSTMPSPVEKSESFPESTAFRIERCSGIAVDDGRKKNGELFAPSITWNGVWGSGKLRLSPSVGNVMGPWKFAGGCGMDDGSIRWSGGITDGGYASGRPRFSNRLVVNGGRRVVLLLFGLLRLLGRRIYRSQTENGATASIEVGSCLSVAILRSYRGMGNLSRRRWNRRSGNEKALPFLRG